MEQDPKKKQAFATAQELKSLIEASGLDGKTKKRVLSALQDLTPQQVTHIAKILFKAKVKIDELNAAFQEELQSTLKDFRTDLRSIVENAKHEWRETREGINRQQDRQALASLEKLLDEA